MARILLGVSGGIAAYKALELARLATHAGHGVRVLMTPTATRFVGAASFEGIVGAPVLIDEFERDPMRGAFPGDAAPRPRPDRPPRGRRQRRRLPDRPGLGQHDREARGRASPTRWSPPPSSPAPAPRAVAPAMNDRMYATRRRRRTSTTLRERGVTVIDPEEGALASRGEHGVGRLPSPERPCSRGSRRWLAGRRAVGRAAGAGDAPAAPASRSTRCASSATARAAAWASRSPSARGAARARR